MKNILNRSDRQIATLDIEASALGFGSYPIEVGIALVRGPSQVIGTGTQFIRPTQAWLKSGLWSPTSEAVHGISLEEIKQQGHPVEDVCDWLNAVLGTKTVVATDAPRYDQDWLDTLFAAAGRKQQFTLYDFEVLTTSFSADQHRQLGHLLRRTPAPHRAGPDALRLAANLMEAHWGHPPRTGPLMPLPGSEKA